MSKQGQPVVKKGQPRATEGRPRIERREGETISAWKSRRAAARGAPAKADIDPSDALAARINAVGKTAPSAERMSKSGAAGSAGGRAAYAGGARLREALPATVRSLMDRGRISEEMAAAAARFMMDYRAGYLAGGTVAYGIRVQGGGGWDEGRALSGQAARERVAAAMAAMRPMPAGCAKAVLIDGVSLAGAGQGSGYADADQRRSWAAALLEMALHELVQFYA